MLFSAEDDESATIRPGLDAAGANQKAVTVVPGGFVDQGERQMIHHLRIIEAQIIRDHVSLVVIDPLMAYLTGGVDTHKDHDVRRVLAELSDMAKRTECAAVIVRHLNKSSNEKAIYRGGGSIGLIAAARAGYVVGHDQNDQNTRVFAPVKNNLAPMPKPLAFRINAVEIANGLTASRAEWLKGDCSITADMLLGGLRAGSKRVEQGNEIS